MHWSGMSNGHNWLSQQPLAQSILDVFPIGTRQPSEAILAQWMPNAKFFPKDNPGLFIDGFDPWGRERAQIEWIVENFDLVSINTMRRSSDGKLNQRMYFSFVHWQHSMIAYLHINLNCIGHITMGEVRQYKVMEAQFLNGRNVQHYPNPGCTTLSIRFRHAGNLQDYES